MRELGCPCAFRSLDCVLLSYESNLNRYLAKEAARASQAASVAEEAAAAKRKAALDSAAAAETARAAQQKALEDKAKRRARAKRRKPGRRPKQPAFVSKYAAVYPEFRYIFTACHNHAHAIRGGGASHTYTSMNAPETSIEASIRSIISLCVTVQRPPCAVHTRGSLVDPCASCVPAGMRTSTSSFATTTARSKCQSASSRHWLQATRLVVVMSQQRAREVAVAVAVAVVVLRATAAVMSQRVTKAQLPPSCTNGTFGACRTARRCTRWSRVP